MGINGFLHFKNDISADSFLSNTHTHTLFFSLTVFICPLTAVHRESV